jgi:5-methylcytosine-specific restriction endonuclease McrA
MTSRNNGSFRKNRKVVLERNFIQNHGTYVCEYCGKRDLVKSAQNGKVFDNMLTVDHFIPLAKGGTNGKSNLLVTCWRCNVIKADSHPITIAGSDDLPTFKQFWNSWVEGL